MLQFMLLSDMIKRHSNIQEQLTDCVMKADITHLNVCKLSLLLLSMMKYGTARSKQLFFGFECSFQ